MTCPKCGTKLVFEVELTGGCQGHSGDEYCYCDSPDVHIDVYCNGMRNHRRCGYRKRIITDRYSLERFFTEHYTPKDNTNQS